MSKQWGPGSDAHTLPAVPAEPLKTRQRDICATPCVAKRQVREERGPAEIMQASGQLRRIITHMQFSECSRLKV